ncbi:G-type lectin S-receptor-like serine/threonine-protein kinase At1g11330 [Papaver somniferum]|uniref:G-type lectin S-receptor-like serine/threonine-protein kinase At1g11330 n=1 Tax=Papaver somniferum TaxID=3469 RepID=UPI000E6F4F08|nr:G-type lectin S-receptor-like serine/threonine-protein kinase At1g11330 [Papaver somniferum]
MDDNSWFFLCVLVFGFLMCNQPHHTFALDTISIDDSLTGDQTIISRGGVFELGFFKSSKSQNHYYIGIWYEKIPVQTIVWVANRNEPILDPSSSKLTLLDGNLVLLHNLSNIPMWSTHIASNSLNTPQVVLGDDGNLVLRDGSNPSVTIWQTFDYPTDTWLPGGKLRFNKKTNQSQKLTSWRNLEDPAMGFYNVVSDSRHKGNIQFLIYWNNSKLSWDSGEWDEKSNTFLLAPELKLDFNVIYSYISNVDESYFTYSLYNNSIMSGQIKKFVRSKGMKKWNLDWVQPEQLCDVYGTCGPFGNCNQDTQKCECLPGFVPRSSEDWSQQDSTAQECKSACQDTCSCNAYAFDSRCQLWDGDIVNFKSIASSNRAREVFYLRSEATEGRLIGFKGVLTRFLKYNLNTNMFDDSERKGDTHELQIFNFACLSNATNNFSLKNKLGEGGFGPVYKGKLQNEQEIAVKRLSKSSGQGIEKFKNEVLLISKLQHRNLVKLLGCCTEGEENMLIYEYMPKKSLDAFLFDARRKAQLDWDTRFNIIGGVARGLLYLHRDSRLRIIHRDLKVSNILLDENMTPKMSDFGMARIFGGDQIITNTNRVVGTFGYMSPEYIMGGTFSEKSDVFSFGVLILEIVSSKRNHSFDNPEQPSTSCKYKSNYSSTWRLWNEGKWSEVVDEALGNLYSPLEVIKCIHIGLLCVQNRAMDRPNMAEVDLMLVSETDRPAPKEPPYTFPTSSYKPRSSNNITFTAVEGR